MFAAIDVHSTPGSGRRGAFAGAAHACAIGHQARACSAFCTQV